MRDSLRLSAGLEEAAGQAGERGLADGLGPDGELAGDVEQPPPRVAQAEDHRAPGEDLDLLAGGQHQAEMPALRVALAWLWSWRGHGCSGGSRPLHLVGPVLDVGDPHQLALEVDQEDRLHAVAEAMEALDGGQPRVEARAPEGVGPMWIGRVVRGAKQEHAGGDPAVLVGRQGGDPQGLEHRGDAIGADGVQEVGDDQVFGDVLESLECDRPVPGRRALGTAGRGRGRPSRPSCVPGARAGPALGPEGQPGAQPLDPQPEPVRVDRAACNGRIGGGVPVDNAAVAGHLQMTVREEMLERAARSTI